MEIRSIEIKLDEITHDDKTELLKISKRKEPYPLLIGPFHYGRGFIVQLDFEAYDRPSALRPIRYKAFLKMEGHPKELRIYDRTGE